MTHVLETTDSRLLADLNEEIQNLPSRLYPAIFKPYDRTRILVAFEQFVADPTIKAFVVFREDLPVGYVLISVKAKKESAFNFGYQLLYINQILVLHQNRSQGLGKALLDRVYSEAKSLSITRIELDHWTLNESARYFFKEAGFQYFNEKMFKLIE